MPDDYEFRHQTTKQKAILVILKIAVFIMLSINFYALGWGDIDDQEKLGSIGAILIFIWVYSNLLAVKVEIQELFIPPFHIRNGVEFLFVGALLSTYDMIMTIINIIRMS